MVLLHEEHLRRFGQTWRQALAARVILSPTRDPNYASLGALGRHVLSAAGGYLVWMCEVLRLPDPGVRPAPDAITIVRDADGYMEHVLERWGAEALREISDEQLETPVPIALGDALLHRFDVRARCHASRPPHLSVG